MMKTETIDRPTFQAILRSVPHEQVQMVPGVHPRSISAAQVLDTDGQLLAQATYRGNSPAHYERVLR
jgi:hypothetical protein